MTKFVPKEVLGDSTFVSVYDPESGDTGYVRMGDLVSKSESTVTAVTGPGGGVELSAGGRRIAVGSDVRGTGNVVYSAAGKYGLTYSGGVNAPTVTYGNGNVWLESPVGAYTEINFAPLAVQQLCPKRFAIEMECDDWTKIGSMTYYIGATGFTSYYMRVLNAKVTGVTAETAMTGSGKRTLWFDRHALVGGGGTAPDFSTTMFSIHKLRVTPAAGQAAKFSVKRVIFDPVDVPSISLTFDDGYKSILTNAMPVLNELGLKASWAIIADQIGSGARYATIDDLRTWLSHGHELVVHGPIGGTGNVSKHGTVQGALDDMAFNRKFLVDNGLGRDGSENVYVWPQGVYFMGSDRLNTDIRDGAAQLGFVGARGTEGMQFFNSRIAGRGIRRWTIPIIGYQYGVEEETLNITNNLARIDKCWEEGKSGCFMFHEVGVASPADISTANFTTLMTRIAQRVAEGRLINPLFSKQVTWDAQGVGYLSDGI